MASLGSLVVSLAVDTARFQGDLGRAAAIAESRMRNIKDTAARSLGALSVVASAAGAALVTALKAATDRADDMRDMAAAAGVTTEELSRLAFAASQSGVEVEQVVKALGKLAKNGSANPAEDLAALADEFKNMPDGAAKTARAIEVFGEKLGPGLIPLLNEGREGLKNLADEADRLGATISTATAAAADEFNDKLGTLRAASQGFGQLLAAELLPTLNGLMDELLSSATAADTLRTAAEYAANAIRLLITVVDAIVTTFVSAGRTVGALGAAMVAFASGDYSRAWEIVRQRNADAEAETKAARDRFDAIWSKPIKLPPAPVPEMTEVVVTAKKWGPADIAKEAAEAAKRERAVLAAVDRERQADIETRKNRHESFSDSVDEFAPLVESLQNAKIELDDFTQFTVQQADIAKAAWAEQAAAMNEQFVDRLLALRGNFRDFLKDLLRMFAQSQLKEGLMGIFGSGGSFGSNGFAGFVGDLFGGFFAGGGDPPVGKYSVVGENGPELIFPKGASTVVPAGAMGGGGGGPVVINQSNNYSGLGLSYDQVLALQERNNRDLLRAFQDSQDRQGQRVTRFSR